MALLLLLALAMASFACSSTSTSSSSSSSSSSGDPGSDPTDVDHVQRSGNALLMTLAAVVAADSAFNFDPTIDPAAPAEKNVANIQVNVSRAACANLSTTGTTTINVDYGAKCVVGAMTLAGSMSIAVSKSGATTTLALTFTNLSVSGTRLSGTASFATLNGSTFTVTLDVTSGVHAVSGTITVVGRSGVFDVDGQITVKSGVPSATVTFAKVTYTRGQCYPNAGSVTVDSALGKTTYDLTIVTTTNGQVQVTKNGVPKDSIALPSYGSCGVG